MNKDQVRLIPLGGLGEIGLNMMILEYGESMIIIDCGLMFPESHMFGIEVVIPNFQYVLEHQDKLEGIFITHGHEDHIGALPFLLKELREIDVPIYAPQFATELLQHKFSERKIKKDVHVISDGDIIDASPFQIQFIEMVHSIVDSFALLIKTPAGNIFHTGDFKFDRYLPRPLEKLKEISQKEKIQLLLADSTNVERSDRSLSEFDILENFDEIFAKEQARIVIGVFASNIRRIGNLLELAKKYKRKVYLDGRSMHQYTLIAQRLGILKHADVITDYLDPKDPNYVLIVTGSQAEPHASLTRLAYKTHSEIRLREGDLVILSSRFIPGNERAIQKLLNHMSDQGVRILYGDISDIHTSGHAHREELQELHQLLKPAYFVPIHGEVRHLRMHADLAAETIGSKNTLIVKDGDVVEITSKNIKITERVDTSYVLVDSIAGPDLDDTIVKDRRFLSEKGIIFIVIIRDAMDAHVIEGPHIYNKGFLSEAKHSRLFEDIRKRTLSVLRKKQANSEEAAEEVRIHVRRYFKELNLKRPMILPIVLDI
ncbi:MAG: ribonuclease J [Deltaproteobacteria bacterium]|nr:ribonuclease J [Deltaproteobacteria bacterium]